MLVLSRKRSEQIVIDNDIVVTVLDIRGNQISLGVDAHTDVPVHRKEIHAAIKRQEVHKEGIGESDSTYSP